MTMHLLPIYYNTNSSKKRKPSSSRRAAIAKAEHAEWVLSMTGGKKADKKLLGKIALREYAEGMSTNKLSSSSGITAGAFAKKESQVYSGERKLLGVATMHKSNMVPVFADTKEVAIDIARMRRG